MSIKEALITGLTGVVIIGGFSWRLQAVTRERTLLESRVTSLEKALENERIYVERFNKTRVEIDKQHKSIIEEISRVDPDWGDQPVPDDVLGVCNAILQCVPSSGGASNPL